MHSKTIAKVSSTVVIAILTFFFSTDITQVATDDVGFILTWHLPYALVVLSLGAAVVAEWIGRRWGYKLGLAALIPTTAVALYYGYVAVRTIGLLLATLESQGEFILTSSGGLEYIGILLLAVVSPVALLATLLYLRRTRNG